MAVNRLFQPPLRVRVLNAPQTLSLPPLAAPILFFGGTETDITTTIIPFLDSALFPAHSAMLLLRGVKREGGNALMEDCMHWLQPRAATDKIDQINI